ncbi:hypothetical protein RDI58_029079 [Solanum bulbocastanum]|uniref:DM2 domain-containing protein n=1 Tax=Solanum bulbocastanum TaxID=147425 RepID=A0AAN8SR73_SOLBU
MVSSSRVFGIYCRTLMVVAKTSTRKTSPATTTTTAGKGRCKGILKPQPISPALQKFVGTFEISRTDVVKKIWDFIKTINLQVHFSCPLYVN